MHGLVFYIGLGLGLAAACGLRPYLPALLAGGLASADALGVHFGGHFHFLQTSWWLLGVATALAASYLAQLRARSARVQALVASAVTGQALAAGALLFAGTLAAHADAWWPGLFAGAVAAALGAAVAEPILSGARTRLRDRAAREALTVYVDAASLCLAALVALLHPLGYLAAAALVWLLVRVRSRAGVRPGGLRITRG